MMRCETGDNRLSTLPSADFPEQEFIAEFSRWPSAGIVVLRDASGAVVQRVFGRWVPEEEVVGVAEKSSVEKPSTLAVRILFARVKEDGQSPSLCLYLQERRQGARGVSSQVWYSRILRGNCP